MQSPLDKTKLLFLGKDLYNDTHEVDIFFYNVEKPSIVMQCDSNYSTKTISEINTNIDKYVSTPFLSYMLIAEDKGLWTREQL